MSVLHAEIGGRRETPAVGALPPEQRAAIAAEVRGILQNHLRQLECAYRHEAAFGARLAGCRTLPEAAELCGEWMIHRLDTAAAMQHQFLEVWLRAAGTAGLSPPGEPDPKRAVRER